MLIDRAKLQAELADYDSQRTNAQQQAEVWRLKGVHADGAWQAVTALLTMLDESETPDATLPAPSVPVAPDRVRRGRRKLADSDSATGSAPSDAHAALLGQSAANDLAHATALGDAQRDAGNANPLA